MGSIPIIAIKINYKFLKKKERAGVAKLVDAPDLGSGALEGFASSSLASRIFSKIMGYGQVV